MESPDGTSTDLDTALIDPIKFVQESLLDSTHSDETILFLSLKNNYCDELISVIMDDYICNVITETAEHEPLLHLAIKRETTLVTRKLLEYGANLLSVNNEGYTPFHKVIRDNRLDQLLELLKWLDVPLDSIRGSKDETLLMFGINYKSSDDILLSLLNHGCDVNIQNNEGFSALHYCAFRKSVLVAQKIIENGADLNITTYVKNTPLHFGVRLAHVEYVCMLLYYNASVHEEDGSGKTVFYDAIWVEFNSNDRPKAEEIARYLIEYIDDFKAKYINTVFEMAVSKDADILPELLKRGANINAIRRGSNNERVHLLYLAWKYCLSYEVLKSFWDGTDFKLFFTTELYVIDRTKTFLEVFCTNCRLPDEQFLQYLYMMFNSPHITELACRPKQNATKFVIYYIVTKRNYSLETRIELISLFLSCNTEIHVKDVCCLYDRYGFDESVEWLLMSGCKILQNPFASVDSENLIVHRMCFDNIDAYIVECNEDPEDFFCLPSENINREFEDKDFIKAYKIKRRHRRIYFKFYRATFQSHCNLEGISSRGELSSLLELSRNVVRKVIYKKWSTPVSFRVYEAISKLPVPDGIRDILYLRTPIYSH